MSELFTTPSPALRSGIVALHAALPKALGLKHGHLREMPRTVAELSRRLTGERSRLADYAGDPKFVAAYCAYFLPWNLLRLGALLPGLELELVDGDKILDLGSGPLTLPLALWLARPDLREKRLTMVAADRSKRMLAAGRALFESLAGKENGAGAWRVVTVPGPVHETLAKERGKARLLTAVNLFNEVAQGKAGYAALDKPLQAMARLAEALLVVEPGTRLGGGVVSRLRQDAVGRGFIPAAPCTHVAACPLLPAPGQNMWCHFRFSTGLTPQPLAELTEAAGLAKTELALSFVHLRKEPGTQGPARVLSEPMDLQAGGSGVYACAPEGLLLIAGQGAGRLRPGQAVAYDLDPAGGADPKSGARLATLTKAP